MLGNKLEQIKSAEKEPSEEEIIFRELVTNGIINQILPELKSLDFDDETVREFSEELRKINDWEELSALLSWPLTIRKRIFSEFKSKTSQEIINGLRNKLKKFVAHGYNLPKLGFHTSGSDIKPERNQKGELAWNVKGTERSDLAEGLQAFAADNLANLYHEGESDKLYVVRLGMSAKKFRNQEGHWHDSSFPIVAKLDTEDIYQQIRNRMKKSSQKLVA